MIERPEILAALLMTRIEADGFGRVDRHAVLSDVVDVLGAQMANWQRIEAAEREWLAARNAAVAGGTWRPGPAMRRYEDAGDFLAAVLTCCAGGASDADRAARIEAAARQVLASGQARYDAEEVHTCDLVPAGSIRALRDAVGGRTSCACVPPAVLEYAVRLGLALLLREAAELLGPNAADDARRSCARRLIRAADRIEADSPAVEVLAADETTPRPLAAREVDEIAGIAAEGVPIGPNMVGRLCVDWRRLTGQNRRLACQALHDRLAALDAQVECDRPAAENEALQMVMPAAVWTPEFPTEPGRRWVLEASEWGGDEDQVFEAVFWHETGLGGELVYAPDSGIVRVLSCATLFGPLVGPPPGWREALASRRRGGGEGTGAPMPELARDLEALRQIEADDEKGDDPPPPGACPECRIVGRHKLACSLRDGEQVRVDAVLEQRP